jgi:hypothetical protein
VRQQVLSGHALEHDGGGGFVVDAVGQRNEAIGGHESALGVGADRRRCVGHTLADAQVAHALAHGFDDAGCLEPRHERQLRRRIQPRAVVDVDEIESDRRLPEQDLSGARRPDLDFLEAQSVRPAHLMHAHDTGHPIPPCEASVTGYCGLDRSPSKDRCPPGTWSTARLPKSNSVR